MDLLNSIKSHSDLLALDDDQRELLCQQIRTFLVDRVSKTGGHLASNLGAVELSVALETVYDTQKDRLVFDVGHQSYVHKMLTGRQADFDHLRQFGGMAGFPKPSESDADAFVAGHASSSVSIALGMARARTLQGADYEVVALIGDGAATGGMAYEGLSDAAESREPLVIILNDNAMSIAQNVGGVARHLGRIRTRASYLGLKAHYRKILSRNKAGRIIYRITRSIKDRIKHMLLPVSIFDSMGLRYLGPVDGNDVNTLVDLLKKAKAMRCPVLIHVMTKKGLGFAPAEEDPSKFHGLGKFDPVTGETAPKSKESFSDSFGSTMLELAAEDDRVCAITAAMPTGTGLADFVKTYPQRTFDVGIAEEHAVSMAGGLAKQGMVPVVAIYSTFLQRAYDQILQDICMLNLHVVFAVDRAGLVGEDGETHHGIYDVGFLRHAPGMKLLCPANLEEQKSMLRWAVRDCNGPVAVRYPRGGDGNYLQSDFVPGQNVYRHASGADVTLITYGTLINNVLSAADLLKDHGVQATVLRLTELSQIDTTHILKNMSKTKRIVVVEEIAGGCGIAQELAWLLHQYDKDILVDAIDLGKRYITHGNTNRLYSHYGLDAKSIADLVLEGREDEE